MSEEITLKTHKYNGDSHKSEIFFFIIILLLCAVIGGLIWYTQKNGTTDNTNTDSSFATITPKASEPAATLTPTATLEATVTPTTAITSSPTISPTPGIGTAIYFGYPATETDYNTLSAVYRDTDITGTGIYSYIISQTLSGPTAAEKAAGLTGVLTLSGSSTCGSSSFQFDRTGNTLTVKFCKNINYVLNSGSGGAYAGVSLAASGRLIQALTNSLKVDGVNTVIIRNPDGSCFAKDSGANQSCTD